MTYFYIFPYFHPLRLNLALIFEPLHFCLNGVPRVVMCLCGRSFAGYASPHPCTRAPASSVYVYKNHYNNASLKSLRGARLVLCSQSDILLKIHTAIHHLPSLQIIIFSILHSRADGGTTMPVSATFKRASRGTLSTSKW